MIEKKRDICKKCHASVDGFFNPDGELICPRCSFSEWTRWEKNWEREQRAGKKPPKATAARLGLGIASLTIGVILAICTIPAAVNFEIHTWGVLIGVTVLPLALLAGVCGWIGRTSATGVAGLCLSILAATEAFGVLGYTHY